MLDGTNPAAPEPAEQTSPEAEANQEPVNLEAVPEDATEVPETPVVDDDSEEVEYEGDNYRLPKKLKDALLRQSDYTRKTQEVAEQRKSIEASQQAFKQEQEATRAHLQDIGRVHAMAEQLAQYDQIDWNTLQQTDPFQANHLFQQRTLLKDRIDSLTRKVQAAEWERSQKAENEFSTRYAETNATLAREIKGWNQDVANKLRDFAKANGATDADIRTLAVNVPLVKLLHKAFLGDQLINAKQTQAKTAEPKIEPKPLTKVTGAGARPGLTVHTADSMDDYVALRKKQGFGKR